MATLDLDKLISLPADTGQTKPSSTLAWCLSKHSGGPCPDDGRNIWLTGLALFCNEQGVPEAELLDWALSHPPLATHREDRIRTTIRGNYTRHSAAFASKAYRDSVSYGVDTTTSALLPNQTEASPFANTPIIPGDVYASLPPLLLEVVAPFHSGRERDVVLTGALAVLSGCAPGVWGTYGDSRHGTNLFAFIVAPPASGKGNMRWARALATPAHQARVLESQQAHDQYTLELAAYEAAKRLAPKGAAPPTSPVVPPFRLLIIPGNNSAAGILKTLYHNDGHGIICESEADTLSGALKQDWGNFSDLLRKAFHHEPASVNRKTNSEYLEVVRPCLSIALTGTPGQVVGLIPTAENGLFSRFLFYCYDSPAVWRDVGPTAGREDLDRYFASLGKRVHKMMSLVQPPNPDGTGGLQAQLAQAQWEAINATGHRWLSRAKALPEADGAASIVFRMGLSMFRVAMLLALLRAYDQGHRLNGQLPMEDRDLTTALALGDVYLSHSLVLLDRMPSSASGLTAPRSKWADKAEQQERVKELHSQGLSVRTIAERTGLGKSTVDRWLK
ncbi:DUF3987 domain-containing protein [Hymenobacter oligotrophus]|uniref:DUF3987 domain-containing protein n=1 Tax=Hymenobacter oligotrophus TaxID=2319843 RepID=A0A3B7QXF4_9BACT|nr:DUF3987 domain-containing protein [Hymenobacter oligotrophus]AYA37828.1 DUF3987 domain-containing protein [Hymenobacter oligotrophus]